MMDWPVAAVILGLFVPLTASILKFVPQRRGRSMEMKPALNATVEEKLDKLQEDVGQIEIDVGVLKNSMSHTERDVNGLRGQLDSVRSEIAALKDMLVKHILRIEPRPG